MFHAVLFISNNRTQVYIFHTPENISFHKRIHLFQLRNQVLDLHTLGDTAVSYTHLDVYKRQVHDITKNAGVAKGTFYLYFKDKYALRDHLIASTAQSLFQEAHQASLNQDLPTFEDHVIFVVDYIINQMIKNKPCLLYTSRCV